MADGDRTKSRSQRTDLGSARSVVDRQRADTSRRFNLRPSAFDCVSARCIGCETHTPGRLRRPSIHRTHETGAPTRQCADCLSDPSAYPSVWTDWDERNPASRRHQTPSQPVHHRAVLPESPAAIAGTAADPLRLLRTTHRADKSERGRDSIDLLHDEAKAASAPPARPAIPPAHQHITRVRRN